MAHLVRCAQVLWSDRYEVVRYVYVCMVSYTQ